jgi:hypothetical protein
MMKAKTCCLCWERVDGRTHKLEEEKLTGQNYMVFTDESRDHVFGCDHLKPNLEMISIDNGRIRTYPGLLESQWVRKYLQSGKYST